MPVTLVKSTWASGGLVFRPSPYTNPPAVMLQIGDTNGVSKAAGVTGLYSWINANTTAVTGTVRAVRGNVRAVVASAAGTFRAGEFYAGSGSSATGADAVNAGTLEGVVASVIVAAASATVTNAHGINVIMDTNAATTAITTSMGIRVALQTGSSQGTHTDEHGIVILNEDVEGTGSACTSAISIGQISRSSHFKYGIDMSPSIPDGSNGTVVAGAFSIAALRLDNSVCVITGTGEPTNGTGGTGAGYAAAGSIYVEATSGAGRLRVNTNTTASPTWTILATTTS